VAREGFIHLHYDAEDVGVAKPCKGGFYKIIRALAKEKNYSFFFLK